MPDITMCDSEECPSRKDCYRHEAKPSPMRQAYADFYKGGKACLHFTPNYTPAGPQHSERKP